MEPHVSQQAYISFMKFTNSGRPYLKDIHNLFAALIIQIPLNTHKHLFRNYTNTFTSEDAIQTLSNLKYSHTEYKNDPNDPSKQQCTTTTTNFNMKKIMAKSLCQQFLICCLMENAINNQNQTFREKCIWSLTQKGITILQGFCSRSEIDILKRGSSFKDMNTIRLIHLKRDLESDQLVLNYTSVLFIFRLLMHSLSTENGSTSYGSTGHLSTSHQCSNNIQLASSNSFTALSLVPPHFAKSSGESISNSHNNLKGNHFSILSSSNPANRSTYGKITRRFFSPRICITWFQNYSTCLSKEEAESIIFEFIKYNWIKYENPKYNNTAPSRISSATILVVTEKGESILNDTKSSSTMCAQSQSEFSKSNLSKGNIYSEEKNTNDYENALFENYNSSLITITELKPDKIQTENTQPFTYDSSTSYNIKLASIIDPKESSSARLKVILENSNLCSPFKDFLQANFCEENLNFWMDYNALHKKHRNHYTVLFTQNRNDLLDDIYRIWSTYLDVGSPYELNIDQHLRQEINRLVNSLRTAKPTHSSQDNSTAITKPPESESLLTVLRLFDRVNEHICRLMASDSVPKFIRTENYRRIVDTMEGFKKQNNGLH